MTALLRLAPPVEPSAQLHPNGPSRAQLLAAAGPALRATLSAAELHTLEWCWEFWARGNQLPPEWAWRGWLLLAGRAFGKTRTAAEWIRQRVYQGAQFIALVGAKAGDVRDVMVEGRSGVLRVFPPHERPRFESSKRQIRFHTGAIAKLYYATEPEDLRGPEHDTAWIDEPAKCSVVGDLNATWDNLMMGLRGGDDPRWIATTTPLPLTLLRVLLKDSTVAVSRGTTYDNAANLPTGFYGEILKKYEGTRLGSQELMGEILEVEGALFKPEWVRRAGVAPLRQRTVVAIDPAISHRHDDTGIVVVARGRDDCGYVLEDLSQRTSPDTWARDAVRAYVRHKADLMIGERDRGGDMVGTIIQSIARELRVNINYHDVKAFKGKGQRAEPVAALYEQGRVYHVGTFKELEDQMTTWDPRAAAMGKAKSPDRLDALVHGMNELFGCDLISSYEPSIRGRSTRQ